MRMGTAAERASLWKKAMASAMVFSITLRRAERSTSLAATVRAVRRRRVRKAMPMASSRARLASVVRRLSKTSSADGGRPALHHGGAAARVHPARIRGERDALGNDVEAGEEGETRIEGLGHDLA